MLSEAVAVTLWQWGDTNNDLTVDFTDIARAVDGFKRLFSETLTLEQTDLYGVEECTPERDVTFADISKTVDAFKGVAYPCPDLCP